jgi:hypothetical protein
MTPRSRGWRLAVAGSGLLVLVQPTAIAAQEVPPFGPALGQKADVVRSFRLRATGAVTKEVTGKKGDGKTGLVGQCNPASWANFGIQVGTSMGTEQASIAVVTQDKVGTGATGEFKLDKIYVDFLSIQGASIQSLRFAGRGVLTLATHDGSPGKRRMIGSIRGANLEGLDDAAGKRIDVEAAFDMDFSCGVK